ncbi:MAG: FAD-binding oxidoreductase [Nitrospinota bacterium]
MLGDSNQSISISPLDLPREARWRAETGRVVRCDHVVEAYWMLEIEAPHAAQHAGPGQFVMVRPKSWDGLLLGRPFDVFRTHPDRGAFEILIKVKGEGTETLSRLRPGDAIDVVGPSGCLLDLSKCAPGVGFIARGAGVTPMVRIAQSCAEIGLSCYGLVSAREERLLLGVGELRGLGAEVETASDEAGDSAGKPAEVVDSWMRANRLGVLFTCGSRRMGRLVQKVTAQGGARGYIFLEYRMACGTGICVGCAAPLLTRKGDFRYGLVCMEGPAFAAESVILDWENAAPRKSD